MSDNFPQCLIFTLGCEGGAFDDPRATFTDHGIQQDIYDDFCARREDWSSNDVRHLTAEEVSTFYRIEYWQVCNCDKLPKEIAMVVFDAAVNNGPGTSLKFLREAIGLPVDGDVSILIHWANMVNALDACTKAIKARRAYDDNLNDPRYAQGWKNRCDRLCRALGIDPKLTYASVPESTTEQQ